MNHGFIVTIPTAWLHIYLKMMLEVPEKVANGQDSISFGSVGVGIMPKAGACTLG